MVQSSKLLQVYAMCSLQGRVHLVSVCSFFELSLRNSIEPSQLMYFIGRFSSDNASVLGSSTEASPLSSLSFFTGEMKLLQLLCMPSPWPFSTLFPLQPAEGRVEFGGVHSWLISTCVHLGTFCCLLLK